MLTDDRTIHDILSAVEHSRIPPLETVKAICTRVLEAEARVKALETEGAQLAANQCHDGYGDEWGNHRCRAQDTLRARVKVLEDALREILDEIGDQNYHEVYALVRYALEGK